MPIEMRPLLVTVALLVLVCAAAGKPLPDNDWPEPEETLVPDWEDIMPIVPPDDTTEMLYHLYLPYVQR